MKFSIRKVFISVVIAGALAALSFQLGYQRGGLNARNNLAGNGAGQKGRSAAARINAVLTAGLPSGAISLGDLMHGPIHPDADLLARWAKGLTPEECVDAMNSLQSQPAGQPRDDILKAVVNAWADRDQKSLLAAAGNIAAPKFRESGVTEALKTLAASSPKEALAWIKDNATDVSNGDLSKRFGAAFASYGANDPQGALDAAMALAVDGANNKQIQTRAVEGIAEGLSNQGRFADAVALFNTMPADGKLQNDALSRVADIWGAVAPQDAANWVATITNPTLVNDLGQSLTDAWAASDPAAAAKWAAQMDQQISATPAAAGNGNNNGADALLSNAMDVWAKHDLNAAGQFLNQLPASAAKDSAIATFVAQAAKDDPFSAMNWATSITDPKAQQQAVQQVAKQWAKTDSAALSQYLATTPNLNSAQIQAVIVATQKPAGGKGGQNGQN